MKSDALALLAASLLGAAPASAQFAHESPVLEVQRRGPRLDALIFSDVVKNRLWRWTPGQGTDVVLDPSGTLKRVRTRRSSPARTAPRSTRRDAS